jgi:hypothetical protein
MRFTVNSLSIFPQADNFQVDRPPVVCQPENDGQNKFDELLSCYAAKFDNHNLLELCGAGILPARIIQTKCTTA